MSSALPKLVRDRIPEVVRSRGEWPVEHKATTDKELDRRLRRKLVEESEEVLAVAVDSPSEGLAKLIEEMADVREVMVTLAELHGIREEDIEKVRISKRKEYGGFDTRTVLELILKEKT